MRLEQLVPYIFLTGGLLIGVSIFWYLRLWERGEEARWDTARAEPSDRLPDRLEGRGPRRLPRLFLVGFALCVLSGPMVLWMLISRGDVDAPVAAFDARLERLLAERLPDLETRQRQHEELIEAILEAGALPRSPGGAGSSARRPPALEARRPAAAASGRVKLTPHITFPWGGALLSSVAAVLLLAAGAITVSNTDRGGGKLLGLLIALLGVAIFVSANPELVTYTVAPLEAVPHTGVGTPGGLGAGASADSTAQASASPGDPSGSVRMARVGRVGPFAPGGDTLDARALAPVRSAIAALGGGGRIVFVLLVGRSDKQMLTHDALRRYGSNLGLAQARAQWVRGELLRRPPARLDGEQVLALPGGPRHVGRTPAADALAEDRAVDVYVCYAAGPLR